MRKVNPLLALMSIALFIGAEAYGQSLSAGGKLYDKWWKQAEVDEPSGDQPLWATQSTNTRSGSDTWRCKECHGWDYKGAAGAYGSGSHFSGFAGVLDAAGQLTEAQLIAWLDGTTNSDHDFSAMGADQISTLANFLSEGLVDVAPFIDATTKEAIGGDAASGEQRYAVCAGCHGSDGTAINFSGDPADPDFVGTIATGNPWEFIHKVRAGQPGTAMTSSIDLGWSMSDVVDVLAYAQSLPTEALTEDLSLSAGGKLYDKWWKQAEVDEPSGDQPLWATQSTNTRSGSDTWRCKECHGWDYRGAAGAYGSGSHFSGFSGVLDAAGQLSEAQLIAWLDGTTSSDHDFSAMGADQMANLAHFLSEELVDVAPSIDAATKQAIGGNKANGRQLYRNTCGGCHGGDGAAINFHDADDPTFVGTVANDNPWEFIHKVRSGQPATAMSSSIDLGWSMADVVDVLTYAQSSLLTEPRPPVVGIYGPLRELESSAPAGGLTVSGSAAGGSSERARSGKPLTRPLRSWGQIKAHLAEEE